jgi:hypothetical protein
LLSKHVALPEIARLAQRLKVIVNGIPASTPGYDVVNVKGEARRKRWAGSAGATRKVIAFHDAKSGAERWVPTGLVAGGGIDRVWRNYVPRVRIRHELR